MSSVKDLLHRSSLASTESETIDSLPLGRNSSNSTTAPRPLPRPPQILSAVVEKREVSVSEKREFSKEVSQRGSVKETMEKNQSRASSPLLEESEENNKKDDGKVHKFSECFLSNINPSATQAESGRYFVKRTGQLMQKIAEMEEEHAKNINKLLDHEMTKLANHSADGCPNAAQAYMQTQSALRLLSNAHHTFGKFLDETVAKPYIRFAEESEKKIVDLDKLGKFWELEVSNGIKNTQDAQKKCLKNIDALVSAESVDTEANISRTKSTTVQAPVKSSLFNIISDAFSQVKSNAQAKLNPEAHKAELIAKAKSGAQEYRNKVEETNKLMRNFYEMKVPTWNDDLQALEIERLSLLKGGMQKASMLIDGLAPKFREMSKVFSSLSVAIDPDQEIDLFLKNNVVKYSQIPPYLVYYIAPEFQQVLNELDSLDTKRNTAAPPSSSKISRTLLQFAQIDDPNVTIESKIVPKVITVLGNAVRNQLDTEGIFRISASGSDLDYLRDKILQGKYDVAMPDPYVPAALLKEILRSEPLLSEKLYPACIEYAKNLPAAAVNNEDESVLPPMLQAILNETPSLSRATLFYICALMNEASLPEHSQKSKMSLQNLAIVFAPGVMRNPSDNPVSMLQNTKYECSFLVDLVKRLDIAKLLPQY